MKIIISANTSWNIYNFRFNLIKKLIASNHSIIILCQHGKEIKELKKIGCQYYPINIKLVFYLILRTICDPIPIKKLINFIDLLINN